MKHSMIKVTAVAMLATSLIGAPVALAQDKGPAPSETTPMNKPGEMPGMGGDMGGMMGQGGMMGMMGMMSAMMEMMQTCNKMMQAAMPEKEPPAEPEKDG